MFVGFVIGFVCGFYVLAAVILLLIFLDHRIEKHDVLVKYLARTFDLSEETARNIVSNHE